MGGAFGGHKYSTTLVDETIYFAIATRHMTLTIPQRSYLCTASVGGTSWGRSPVRGGVKLADEELWATGFSDPPSAEMQSSISAEVDHRIQ